MHVLSHFEELTLKFKCVHVLFLMESVISVISKLNMVTEAVVFHCTLEFSFCLAVAWWQFKILTL